jgi:hypothetical protein
MIEILIYIAIGFLAGIYAGNKEFRAKVNALMDKIFPKKDK